MPRIAVHTLDDAPEGTRATLEQLTKRTGKLLNIHAEMADSPVVLAAYTGISEAIAKHGSFDPRTREAIALAVGNVDGCDYCQAAHTRSAIAAGFDQAQTVAVRAATIDFDDKLAALLDVVREIAGSVGDVADSTWAAALAAGWSEQELGETFAHVALNLFTNYFNHYARTELDMPAAPALDSAPNSALHSA
jgi:AhpD family alkylhydroperoxidase